MKLSKFLTIILIVILGFGASAAGIYTAQKMTERFDDNVSISAIGELEKVETPKSKYNVLLMGTDAEGGLSDVMMIYQIDPQQKKVRMLSIPRDTRILFNNRSEKINAAHSYGKQQSDGNGGNRADEYAIRAVKELTGIPIHHYVCINFAAFRQIIDALDGFDYDVPQNMDYDDEWQDLHIHLKKGMQHLDGDKAEQLVRYRHYPNGDVDRIAVQQDVLKELFKQKVNPIYITKVPEIFGIIRSNIDTDMSITQAIGMANNILAANGSEDGLETYTVPGVGKYVGSVSYFIADMDATEQLVAEVFGYGEAAMVDAKVSTENK
ncbi:MAG: LCP family protein [Clostridia bacterium]